MLFAFKMISESFIRTDKQVVKLNENSCSVEGVVNTELKIPHKIKCNTKGTFNDTIILGTRKIPPPRINTEYVTDWYADSVWYYFDPYKATKVNLKLVYTFYE